MQRTPSLGLLGQVQGESDTVWWQGELQVRLDVVFQLLLTVGSISMPKSLKEDTCINPNMK